MPADQHPGYVDCHSHILPDIDDGSPDWETSLAMARVALSEGIRRVIATPHWPGDGRSTSEAVRRLAKEATERFHAAGMELTVFPGHECVAESDLLDKLKAGGALPLADSPYVLVESPYTPLPFYFHELLFRLQGGGYRPILAHPERNPTIQEKPETVEELRQLGAYIQVNAGSVNGEFGKAAQRAARTLLQRGEVDLLSTDSHSAGSRAPRLAAALEAAAKLADVQALASRNADLLIRGQYMQPAAPVKAGGMLGFLGKLGLRK